MYKVTYYVVGTMKVAVVMHKWLKSMKQAAAFALTLGSFDVVEIKLFEEEGN